MLFAIANSPTTDAMQHRTKETTHTHEGTADSNPKNQMKTPMSIYPSPKALMMASIHVMSQSSQ